MQAGGEAAGDLALAHGHAVGFEADRGGRRAGAALDDDCHAAGRAAVRERGVQRDPTGTRGHRDRSGLIARWTPACVLRERQHGIWRNLAVAGTGAGGHEVQKLSGRRRDHLDLVAGPEQHGPGEVRSAPPRRPASKRRDARMPSATMPVMLASTDTSSSREVPLSVEAGDVHRPPATPACHERGAKLVRDAGRLENMLVANATVELAAGRLGERADGHSLARE